jgi:tRNA-splicing ligase RtcB (3'-phosphate/5'-hydroxy nucleic acid ligase)
MPTGWSGPLEKLTEFKWRIPKSYKPEMRVDGIVFASERMMESLREDMALEQVANVATLPGILGASMAMPDIHHGYGFCIGGVAAMDAEQGVISPGGVGYDIGCGVRLLRTDLTEKQVKPKLKELADQLYRDVPTGVGSKGRLTMSEPEVAGVLAEGAHWAVAHDLGWPEDLEVTEENARFLQADPGLVSERAMARGRPQLGTLGSGNHFLEVQVVDRIFDADVAAAFGLTGPGQITVMIHSGSRGLGYQVCDDYLAVMQQAILQYGIQLPDRQLACTPLSSPEGRRYVGAMTAAANFAWANRQAMAHWSREAFAHVFRSDARSLGMFQVYDVAHNVCKFEEHQVDGAPRQVAVHRKGATRSYPAGRPEVPAPYRDVGQPVLVPGDMGRYSYVLVGNEAAMRESFGSTCHGAGRRLSRSAAKRALKGVDLQRQLQEQGIFVRAQSSELLAEEAPEAYKDVEDVAKACEGAGLSRCVARLRPIAVIKG